MSKLATELEGQRKDVCKDLEEVGESLIMNPQHIRPLKLFVKKLDDVAIQTEDSDMMFLNSYLSLFVEDMYFNLLTDVSSLVKPEDRDKLIENLGKDLKDLAKAVINNDNKKTLDFITIDADIADEIANDYVDKIKEIREEIKVNKHKLKLAFFDKAYGPIGAIVLANSIISKTGIDAVYVRLRRRLNFDQIKGELNPGDTVIIISDVLTAGDGILNAMDIIKNNHENVKVPYAVVFYDRMQGGKWRLWEKGIEVESRFTRVEFAEGGFKDDASPLLITDDIVPVTKEKEKELVKIFGKEAVKIMENTVVEL